MTQFAMLFPGQGSQSVGMLAELAAVRPEIRATFSEAGEVLGIDLWRLVSEGPAEELNRTELTQPAMLAGGIAVWRAWVAAGGPVPSIMAGHSLGEYSALVAAGAIDFADALKVVAARGRLMQSAVPDGEGAMAAILGLDDELVEAICREAAEGQVVAPANYNSPGQLVIAGHATAVERAMHKCRDAGAKRAMVLPVSVPSHSELMKSAAEELGDVLAGIEIRTPRVAVLHNIDVESRSEPDEIRAALIGQMSAPVRWTATIQAIVSRDILHMAECGPGRVLCGLGRRIEKKVGWVALEQPDQLESTSAEWKE
jgi:[acyl-carrier-protein] S-malonyltransferase